MPNKSSKVKKPSTFASETEEADWLVSPFGRRYADQIPDTGVLATEKRQVDPKLRDEAKRTGKAIYYKNGRDVRPTKPAVIQALMERVKAQQTQAVSLRIPVRDIEAAKKLGAQAGLGYQTVLKEIISKGLR